MKYKLVVSDGRQTRPVPYLESPRCEGETRPRTRETLATGEDTIYGVLEAADVASDEGWVPLELLNGAELHRPVATDEPITEDDVELETDSVLYHLRKLQDQLV